MGPHFKGGYERERAERDATGEVQAWDGCL